MERSDREAQVADIAWLDQPIRRDLYGLLVERDAWLSRDAAADALDIPRSVAAFHLDKLADGGWADVRFERPPGRTGPGAGRPTKWYRRSAKEVSLSLPDRRYDLAAALLADAVAEAAATGRPVEEALADAARQAGQEIGTAVRAERRRARSAAAGAAAVLVALERLGYEPHAREGEIVLANCPFHRLAERHRPLVCAMNLYLLGGLADGLGAEAALGPRLEPTDGLCCVRLSRA